ncbi:hypothetical protein HDU88_004920 [Geranomyces variabilis]|nr:hypothetical protein HDU88_004920 [Geranomyces variabilis]
MAEGKSAAQADKTPETPNGLHDAQSVMSVSAHTQPSEPTTPTQPAADSAARSPVHIPHRLNPQLCQRPVGCGTTYLAASDSEAHKSAASQPERQPRTRRRTGLRAKPPPPLFKRHMYIPQPPRYPTEAPPSPILSTPSPTLSDVTSISQARRPRKPRNRPRRTGSGVAKQNPDAMVGVLEHALKAMSADAALHRRHLDNGEDPDNYEVLSYSTPGYVPTAVQDAAQRREVEARNQPGLQGSNATIGQVMADFARAVGVGLGLVMFRRAPVDTSIALNQLSPQWASSRTRTAFGLALRTTFLQNSTLANPNQLDPESLSATRRSSAVTLCNHRHIVRPRCTTTPTSVSDRLSKVLVKTARTSKRSLGASMSWLATECRFSTQSVQASRRCVGLRSADCNPLQRVAEKPTLSVNYKER